MKWHGISDREIADYEEEMRNWHIVFAYIPHRNRITGEWYWLCKVNRRLYFKGVLGSFFYEYREVTK